MQLSRSSRPLRGASLALATFASLSAGLTAVAGTVGAQTPDHAYSLNGTYADAFGGPSLTPNGGTLGATAYAFGANQGLSLSGALNPAHYSVEVMASFQAGTDLGSYRKILDFKNRSEDCGLYAYTSRLTFFCGSASGSSTLTAGTPFHLLVTRDGTTNLFQAYLGGASQFAFADNAGSAIFNGAGNVAWFFTDDSRIGGEAGAGSIDWIRIYDRPLTGAEVAARFAAGDDPLGAVHVTPEPGTVLLVASGLAGVGLVPRRRRRA